LAVAAEHGVEDPRVRLVADIGGPVVHGQGEALELTAERTDLSLDLPYKVGVVEEKGRAAVRLFVHLVRVDHDLVLAVLADAVHSVCIQFQLLGRHLVHCLAYAWAVLIEIER